jgi:sirohydrochlorin cobaltochelatase
MKSAIILFGHGARDPEWAQPFHRIRAILRARASATPVELAFLEHMRPTLIEAVTALAERGTERITLVPLFMAQGGHLRNDLPVMVQRACAANPGVLIRTSAAIGEVDALLEAIATWATQEEARTRRADLGNPTA